MPITLHIEFSVREPSSERYVTFVDDVPVEKVKDWFARVSMGVEQLFDAAGAPRAIVLVKDNGSRIMAIKLVRELSQCGLREAKDAVEASVANANVPFLICDDGRDAPAIIERFRQENIIIRDGNVDAIDLVMSNKAQRVRPLRPTR